MSQPPQPTRLVVVDDHPLILEGLERLFRLEGDLELVAKCVNAKEALEAVRTLRPDLLLLDLRLPGRRGLEVLEEIQREGLPTRTVLLTGGITEDELLLLGAENAVIGFELSGSDFGAVAEGGDDLVVSEVGERGRGRRRGGLGPQGAGKHC